MIYNTNSLKNKILVAMPTLEEGPFDHAVIYMIEHNAQGALGIIVNKPLRTFKLEDLLEQLGIPVDEAAAIKLDYPILNGGPVNRERGFVIFNNTDDDNERPQLSTDKSILIDYAAGHGPREFLIALGHAGWSAGQLEKELQNNYWLITPAEPDILFNTPHKLRWRKAAATIGVDVDKIYPRAGHA